MKELSIVIVNYRIWTSLNLCLKSIGRQKDLDLDVIVVDNDSGDNRISTFERNYKSAKWIKNSKNHGFAKACNIGASFAKSKWILFLNPDTILDINTLKPLLNFCDKNQDYRLIGINQLNDKSKPANSSGLFLNLWSLTGITRALIKLFKFSKNYEVTFPDWISGSFVLVRKKDFDFLKGWDEDFWMYYEDMDLCRRAKKNGFKTTLLNNWSYTHSHGKASRKNNSIKIIAKTEVIISSHIYIEKHSNKYVKYITHIILILLQSFDLILKSLFSKTYREILKKSIKFWIFGLLKNSWKSNMVTH